MLSERRWSDSSTALKFLKSKANQLTSPNGNHQPSSSAANGGNSTPKSSSSSSSPSAYRRSASAPVSAPIVTVISDDLFPAPALALSPAPFFPSPSSSSSCSTSSAASTEISTALFDGDYQPCSTSVSASNHSSSLSGSSGFLGNGGGDDSVPGFPAGELASSSGSENFIRRLWRKRKSLTINEYDPLFKVVYLGNVLTGWAKGEGCVDRPLATLWRNFKGQNGKHEIQMKLTVSNSGLKAMTKEHGLTEYWSNRVTFCNTHPRFPKVFCWVYRHEGRRLKQELRCHAVLCPSEAKAAKLALALQERLQFALQEFRRDKLNRQKARLSLANCVYDVPSLPRRKQLLSTGMNNYRPPLERSKSAPKLKSIEEGFEESALDDLIEEEEEEAEETTVEIQTETHQHSHLEASNNATPDKMKSRLSPPRPNPEGQEEEEDAEDEVSFAYNLDSSCKKCVRSLDRCAKTDCRCRCGEVLFPASEYGTLPGQLLDVDGAELEDSDSSSESSASPPDSPSTLLPRGSLPAQLEPGPVRPAPSPEPSRSSFSMGSPVCPGKRRKCAAGLCDEPLCRGRANKNLLQLPDLSNLHLTSEGDEAIECNNNVPGVEQPKVKGVGEDNKDKEVLKAVTVAGLVGCFRQSKA